MDCDILISTCTLKRHAAERIAVNRRFITNLFKPFSTILAIVMGVLCVTVLALNTWVGVASIVICIGVWFSHMRIIEKYSQPMLEQQQEKALQDAGEISLAVRTSEAFPICVCGKDGSVYWRNSAAEALEQEGEDISALLREAGADQLFEDPEKRLRIEAGGRYWQLRASRMAGEEERMLLFWRDNTTFEVLRKTYEDSRCCIALVGIDNYDEIISSTAVENQSLVIAEIDKCIRSWATSMEASAIRYRNSNYAVIFEEKYLETLRANNFEILGKMHEIETGADFPTSVSIGIGAEAANFGQLQEQADAALDLAYGRGGDQAVIRKGSGDPEYFGGALPSVEKRNKGRSRLFSHALMQQISMADTVFVMGHSRPDMDALGACMGIAALVGNMDKPVDIVIDTSYEAIEHLYKAAAQSGQYSFVSGEEAIRRLTSDSLLVVVDCHAAYMTQSQELVERANKIIIIDHHRRSKDVIENASLVYMESYASSTSELIAEMLQYAGDRSSISKLEAEALLAGITLDTKNFTVSSGARTFEAASWLKRQGADTAAVNSFFKLNLEFVQKKYNILANAQVMSNGIAVAYTKESDPAMQVLAAQAADELLEMKGITAAFTAGSTGERTCISARSSGNINVQTIMEKLGGGGHRGGAAAQVSEGPEEAIQKLVELLRAQGLL